MEPEHLQSKAPLKTIVYRGGVLKFRIPSSWTEEYSDMDGGTFYEDRPDSGTLRVKVITLEVPPNVKHGSVLELFEPLMRHIVRSEGGDVIDVSQVGKNALMRYQQLLTEEETELKIFYWVFGNPVTPEHARIVTFSYTVLASEANAPRTLEELENLSEEINRTEFGSRIGL
jgi:hypothetical protein